MYKFNSETWLGENESGHGALPAYPGRSQNPHTHIPPASPLFLFPRLHPWESEHRTREKHSGILTLYVLELIHIHFYSKESTRRLQFSTPKLSLGGGSRLFKTPFSKQEFSGPRRKNIGLCMHLTLGSLFLGCRKVSFQLATPDLTLGKKTYVLGVELKMETSRKKEAERPTLEWTFSHLGLPDPPFRTSVYERVRHPQRELRMTSSHGILSHYSNFSDDNSYEKVNTYCHGWWTSPSIGQNLTFSCQQLVMNYCHGWVKFGWRIPW